MVEGEAIIVVQNDIPIPYQAHWSLAALVALVEIISYGDRRLSQVQGAREVAVPDKLSCEHSTHIIARNLIVPSPCKSTTFVVLFPWASTMKSLAKTAAMLYVVSC